VISNLLFWSHNHSKTLVLLAFASEKVRKSNSVFHQVKPVRREHRKDQTGRVPCQGLDFGSVIAKRPPLSDFALRPTRIFKIDEALGSDEPASPSVRSQPKSLGQKCPRLFDVMSRCAVPPPNAKIKKTKALHERDRRLYRSQE